MDGVGETRRFTCPFHAWTYDLDGTLVGLPTAEAFDGMCREEKGLVELPGRRGLRPRRRMPASWAADRHRRVPRPRPRRRAGRARVRRLDPLRRDPRPPVGANWKVTLDTYRENYHFTVPAQDDAQRVRLRRASLTFDAFGPHLRNCSALRSIDTLRDVPDEEWGDVSAHISHQYSLFPNTCMTFDSRHIELWQIVPIAVDRSEVIHTAYLRPGLSDEELAKLVEMAPWICETVVDGEDFWVAGRTEPGLSTGLVETVVFGRNEPAPQHLHKAFRATIAAADRER